MTPEQFSEWQDERPDWISQETAVLAACIKDISDFISYDIGPAMRAERNGDTMWYALTNKEGTSLLVIMCTAYVLFTEATCGDNDVSYGIIDKPLSFLEHLQSIGLRRLTQDEMENFIEGIF
jgi:hypothetical protein